jgi:integrase
MEVSPIRDVKKIAEMRQVLSAKKRDELMFVIGINTALRIGDILSLSVGDVLDDNGQIARTIELREQKTGKKKIFPLNESVKNAIVEYLSERHDRDADSPLFSSRKGGRLSRSQAWRILKAAGKSVGLENIGTHSLRKTFGYHVYKRNNGDIGLVQKLLNHSISGVTLNYIGIDRERIEKTYLELNL